MVPMSKAGKRWIIAAATFLAGLYFVLEFVVPPTLPGATTTGVVLSKTDGRITVRTLAGESRSFPIDSSLKVLKKRITGEAKKEAAEVLIRDVRDGEYVDIQAGDQTVVDA